MAHRDSTSNKCLALAMSATAFGNHRGKDNQKKLSQSIHDMLAVLPVERFHQLPSKDEAADLVQKALLCGRAAGLNGQELRSLFNDTAELVPAPLAQSYAEIETFIHRRKLQ